MLLIREEGVRHGAFNTTSVLVAMLSKARWKDAMAGSTEIDVIVLLGCFEKGGVL